jgi:hypothetical protein
MANDELTMTNGNKIHAETQRRREDDAERYVEH